MRWMHYKASCAQCFTEWKRDQAKKDVDDRVCSYCQAGSGNIPKHESRGRGVSTHADATFFAFDYCLREASRDEIFMHLAEVSTAEQSMGGLRDPMELTFRCNRCVSDDANGAGTVRAISFDVLFSLAVVRCF